MTDLYSASALSTGDARNGHVKTLDGAIDTDVRMPKEMGGNGEGLNPEQFFAAGYAACFHQAVKAVSKQQDVDATDSELVVDVTVAKDDDGLFLKAAIELTLPNADEATARKVIEGAHEMCPYSKATRGNIEVELSVA